MLATWSLGYSVFYTSAAGATTVSVWSLGSSTIRFQYAAVAPTFSGNWFLFF